MDESRIHLFQRPHPSVHQRCPRWAAAALAAGAVLALGACDGGIAEPEALRSTWTIDVGPLLAGAQNRFASVLDHAELTIAREDGQTSTVRMPLTVEEPAAIFDVRVPPGRHRFEGRVISNNGSVLVEGNRVVDVQADGFAVEIDLRAVAPVLVAFPDSGMTIPFDVGEAVFTLGNLGAGSLAWQVVSVDPPQSSCLQSCLRFSPPSGQLGPDSTAVLRVYGPVQARYRGLYRVRLGSQVGTLELKVFAETAPVGAEGG
jgi:hypothetical protein